MADVTGFRMKPGEKVDVIRLVNSWCYSNFVHIFNVVPYINSFASKLGILTNANVSPDLGCIAAVVSN